MNRKEQKLFKASVLRNVRWIGTEKIRSETFKVGISGEFEVRESKSQIEIRSTTSGSRYVFKK